MQAWDSEGTQRKSIRSIAEEIPAISEQFAACGAIGVIVVEAESLTRIESLYGYEARDQVYSTLLETLQALARNHLRENDRVLAAEIGRPTGVLLFFREPGDADFFRRELPSLRDLLREGIAKRGRSIANPYLNETLRTRLGTAMAFSNPTVGTASQLRDLLDTAREDADYHELSEARNQRQTLLDILMRQRIRSVYEPIVEVQSRTVFGYEALARGPRDCALHSPLALFGIAEKEGLLYPLDCLCRRSGLVGAKGLPDGTHLFLNVRPTAIHDPDFRSAALRNTLELCGLSPQDVVLEISEQESIENFEIFREIRDYYRNLGFRIALDDTGAGYASLEAVIELAPDFIKVDRAFVRGVDEDPARQDLLHALQRVADGIGSQIIGEGLDTLEELETLRTLGIRYGQGWLFGHPNPLRADLDEP